MIESLESGFAKFETGAKWEIPASTPANGRETTVRLPKKQAVLAVGFALSDALVQILAVVVRPNMREAYSMVTRDHGKLVAVYAPARESDVDDIIRNIDKLLLA